MIYVMLFLFLISSIGYFRWMRGAFRLMFSSAVFFATSGFLLLMMLSGILHIMKIIYQRLYPNWGFQFFFI